MKHRVANMSPFQRSPSSCVQLAWKRLQPRRKQSGFYKIGIHSTPPRFAQDRFLMERATKIASHFFSCEMLSAQALAPVVELLGPFPMSGYTQKDVWTTKALTEIFWKDRVPAFSLLWLSEPDGTEHETAPGSKEALAAIKSADGNLASVLAVLDRQGARSTTDIFVVSDHGFSTIERSVDLRKILKDASFNATTEFTAEPQSGDIMLAGNGGTVLFYVIQHNPAVTRRLVEFLQQSDF